MTETAARPSPAGHRPPDLIMVGGVPGAGKSTAIRAALAALGPQERTVRTLDSDQVRAQLSARVPADWPYHRYRPWVHVLHLLRVVGWILLGPELAGTRLLVHDPCTRPYRLRTLGRLAESRGWRTALVLVDATRADALAGQVERGRVVRADSFRRHWARWREVRAQALAGGADWSEPWDAVRLVSRTDAPDALSTLLGAGTAPLVLAS